MSWLFVSDRAAADPLGGMTVVLAETAPRLAGIDTESHWVTGRTNDSLPDEGIWQELHLHSFPFSGNLSPAALVEAGRAIRTRVQKVIEEQKITASIVHQPIAGMAAGPVLKRHAIPSCYFFHSPWRQEFLLNTGGRNMMIRLGAEARRLLEARAISSFSRIVVFSDFMADWFRREHPGAPEPVMVTPGVDLERFQPVPDRRQARRELNWPESDLTLLSLRRLVPRTGVDLLLEAFSGISGQHPDARLLIGGRGPLESQLKLKARQLGLSDRVVFLGYIADEHLPLALAAADLVAMPTLALEGLGLVTLEAMASGTVVVGTPVGGTIELLQPFNPELLSAEVSPTSFSEVLHKILTKGREEIHQMGRDARSHVEAEYGWERTAADLKRVLEVS